MAIENFKEVQAWIDTNKESNEELKTYLQGFNKITVEGVQRFLNEDKDAKSWFDSEKDKHGSKSLETWKTNNLQKEIEAEIKKRFPDADPKDVKMKELELKLEQMQKETFKKELINSAIKTATEKELPIKLVDYLLGSDLETTNKNIETFETIFNEHIQKQVEARISGNSHVPPKGGQGGKTEIEALEVERQAALKAGNMPLAISLKNKIVTLQNKK
jgi:hypothetical protein